MYRLHENFSPNRSESKEREYKIFTEPQERREIFDFSKGVAEYLRSEKVPNLVVIDRSSRPLYIGVRDYLKSKYPDEPMPNIYFMNPKGFKAKEEMSPEEINNIIDDCRWKSDLAEAAQQIKSREDILKDVEGSYKKLMADKDKPLLVFDTCIHSGKSIAPVKKVLDQVGFSDIRIGSVNPSDDGAAVKSDFYITKRQPEKNCYPFGDDRIIEKTFSHVYSKRSDDPYYREKSLELREEIKNIIKDFLAK